MDFGLTEEQDQLAATERAWLTKNDHIARIRATLDAGAITIDPAAVAHAAESGLLELLTPEIGGTHVDLAVVTEAHGYGLSSLPVADLDIGAWLPDHLGSPAEDGKLTGLALGPDASLDGDALRLTGVTRPVPMAADMDSIAVAGQVGDGEYLVVLNDPTLSGMSTLDLSRSWARLKLDATIADWTQLPTGTLALLRDALAVHRAFDALGAAARLLDMTVSYAGQREQFGAPIGGSRAVKQPCAAWGVAAGAGRATLWAAALALDTASAAGRSRAASAAAAYTKSAAAKVAGTALQGHGGIGV